MCGICGFIDFRGQSDRDVLQRMISTLRHRGPDDRGEEVFQWGTGVVGLGHTRLSIIDLSEAGRQPMTFGDLTIVFNGEVYNFMEIRNELERIGHRFVSRSDTEVVLHAFAEWGVDSVSRFIGMFAFVLLDRRTRQIRIVRDRAGIKPLFCYWKDDLFLFSSELKAFHQHTRFSKELNVHAVHQFMDYGYVPSPDCIFKDCFKLSAGHILTIDLASKTLTRSKYWDVMEFYDRPCLDISYPDAMEEVERLLTSACEYRMVADVPVGVFLSGGYDSTAVVALLQTARSRRLKTFTLGFEGGNDETPHARTIARHFGTDHSEYFCTSKEAQEIVPRLPQTYDEPFADSSAIPVVLISRLARQDVKVALSADAGDEVFGGYSHYWTLKKNLSMVRALPPGLRALASPVVRRGSAFISGNGLRHKVAVLAQALGVKDSYVPQLLLRSYYELDQRTREDLFPGGPLKYQTVYDADFGRFRDGLSVALATDYVMYLQDDILAKVDRGMMSVSLEGREPLLDHRIIEFVAQLPSSYKYGHVQKRILRDIVHRHIPGRLMMRPKTGFSAPIVSWLRSDLSYLLEEYLDPGTISGMGVFHVEYVEQLKRRFLRSGLDDPLIVWKLLQFSMWYKMWMQ